MNVLDDIGSDWALFLDRDGVINKKIDGYVTKPSEFEFLSGSLDAIRTLSQLFSYIIVVTNQQGIGKGLMTHDDLHSVHSHMLRHVSLMQGRVDNIYYSPYLEHENHYTRKPNPGMALQAANDHPDISFEAAVMVGDSDSDILFGNQLGMKTVRIAPVKDDHADVTCSSLSDFVLYLNR